jgi:hypothetical protein
MIKITDKTVEGVTRGDPSGQPLSWNLIHWINSREEIALLQPKRARTTHRKIFRAAEWRES